MAAFHHRVSFRGLSAASPCPHSLRKRKPGQLRASEQVASKVVGSIFLSTRVRAFYGGVLTAITKADHEFCDEHLAFLDKASLLTEIGVADPPGEPPKHGV